MKNLLNDASKVGLGFTCGGVPRIDYMSPVSYVPMLVHVAIRRVRLAEDVIK
jgi:hypothetical protein